MTMHETYLREAVALARDNVAEGGSPYGALVVRDGAVLARAANAVHRTNDPTDHAEMVALREASRRVGRAKLGDCVVYASGRPCPMCHAAMHLSGVREAYFAYSAEEGEAFGLIGAGIYAELCRPLDAQTMQVRHLALADEPHPYALWQARKDGA